MFAFVVRWLGFLKVVPGLAYLFDAILKLRALAMRPQLLDWIDEIEAEVLKWEGTTISMHKYGGVQFNYKGKEIAHLHSNGLLDILYNRNIKKTLLIAERVLPHHVFSNSGWVSFYVKTEGDIHYAKKLIFVSYINRKNTKVTLNLISLKPTLSDFNSIAETG